MSDDASKAFDTARKILGFMFTRSKDEVVAEMVFPATRAKMAGLEELDVICSVNGDVVSTAQDFASALGKIDISQSFSMEVSRSGEKISLVFPSKTLLQQELATKLVDEQKAEHRRSGVVLASCQFANSGKSSGEGYLLATTDGLEFVAQSGDRHLVPWGEIVDIQVATSATSRVTISRILLIGLFALAAQKKQLFTVVEVETSYTTFAFVTTEAQTQVVETVKPLVARFRQSRATEVTSAQFISSESQGDQNASTTLHTGPPNLSQQIRELAKLRDEGLITDDEFALAKVKILGS